MSRNRLATLLLVCIIGLLFLCGTAAAQGVDAPTAVPDHVRGLGWYDWVVIAASGAGMLALGGFYARRQKTTSEFYVGGRKLGSIAVGISLYATLLSTISYLAVPGEMINKGPVILWSIVALPFTYVTVGYLMIPLLMKYRVTSAYEIIEQRLGVGPRLLAVLLFLGLRFVWMGLMVNVAAKAVAAIIVFDAAAQKDLVPWIVVICSIVAIAYTAMGGLRTVVVTDVVQFVLLMGGAVLTIVAITVHMGGFHWFPTEWSPGWQEQPAFSLDPTVRVTVIGTILSVFLWSVCTAGSDQTAVQRFMATGGAKAARKSYLANVVVGAGNSIILGLVGFALLGFYGSNEQFILGEGGLAQQGDQLFPQYIAHFLPPGIAGLVVAAMFAAVMSSLDSGLNSSTAVIQVDLIDRFRRHRDTEEHNLWTARVLSVVIGVIIILLNVQIAKVKGNIMEVTNKTVNLPTYPLASLFFLAFFVRFTTPFGAIISTIYGLSAAMLVAFWDLIAGGPALSFQWIPVVSLTVNLSLGIALSLLPMRGRAPATPVALGIVAMIPLVAFFVWAASLGIEVAAS